MAHLVEQFARCENTSIFLHLSDEFVACVSCDLVTSGDRCKPFHKEANGYGRGEGVAAVALRPMMAMGASQVEPHALLAGIFQNSDGRSVSPITKPSVEQQKACMAKVWQDGLSCGAMECHGTGTPTGDPIEVKSVGDIFGSQLTCLGALKGNINHTESAAGLAGFIKLVKVVQQHTMFPHGAGLWRPDLSIELAPALMLSENCQALRADANAAGVNCFGFSGTNVHARILPLPEDTSLEAVQISDAQVFCWLPKGWNFRFCHC